MVSRLLQYSHTTLQSYTWTACYESKVHLPHSSTDPRPNLINSQTKLFVTSEVPVYQVFSDDTSNTTNGISDHMRSVMDDLVRSTPYTH